jgi:hypothetical protein
MHKETESRKRLTPLWRAVIEVAFIIFLFYSNLLMGEFTRQNGQGKTLMFALNDIFTGTNFLTAVISAMIGYAVFETLRRKLCRWKGSAPSVRALTLRGAVPYSSRVSARWRVLVPKPLEGDLA